MSSSKACRNRSSTWLLCKHRCNLHPCRRRGTHVSKSSHARLQNVVQRVDVVMGRREGVHQAARALAVPVAATEERGAYESEAGERVHSMAGYGQSSRFQWAVGRGQQGVGLGAAECGTHHIVRPSRHLPACAASPQQPQRPSNSPAHNPAVAGQALGQHHRVLVPLIPCCRLARALLLLFRGRVLRREDALGSLRRDKRKGHQQRR